MIVVVIISYTLLAFFEFVPLYKEKQWVDLYVNCILFLLSLTIVLLLIFGVKIPSPAEPIGKVITSIIGK